MARDKAITIPMDDRELDQLAELARRSGLTRAEVIRRGIQHAVDEAPDYLSRPLDDPRTKFRV